MYRNSSRAWIHRKVPDESFYWIKAFMNWSWLPDDWTQLPIPWRVFDCQKTQLIPVLLQEVTTEAGYIWRYIYRRWTMEKWIDRATKNSVLHKSRWISAFPRARNYARKVWRTIRLFGCTWGKSFWRNSIWWMHAQLRLQQTRRRDYINMVKIRTPWISIIGKQ